jgi:hypothetical protein
MIYGKSWFRATLQSEFTRSSSPDSIYNLIRSARITIDSIKQTQGRSLWGSCKALVLRFGQSADDYTLAEEFVLQGSEKLGVPASIEYVIHVIHLSQEDRHNLRINSEHIPKPSVHAKSRLVFELPLGHVIRCVRSNIATSAGG